MQSPIQASPYPLIPFTTRLILATLIITRLTDIWAPGWATETLSLEMERIVEEYEVWRVVTSWFYEESIGILIIGVVCFGWVVSNFERSNSSPVAFNDVIVNLLSHCLFFFVLHIPLTYLVLVQIDLKFTFVFTWINFTYKTCFYNQDMKILIPFTKVGISLKLLPAILLILVCAFSAEFRYDATLGLFLAILECWKFNGGIILFTKDTYTDKEKYLGYFGITKLNCWIPVREDAIIENHRLTVSSDQFYLKMWPLNTMQPVQQEMGEMTEEVEKQEVEKEEGLKEKQIE